MLTQERLKEVLNYEPETGNFIRKKNLANNGRVGDIAGCIDICGYIQISIDNIHYRGHRLAFLYMEGYFPENQVDHINRDRTDNKWKNLREVSPQCNRRNCGNRADNTSGVKGVVWYKPEKKWQAQIMINGKNKNIGRYNNFMDAVCARLAGEQCLDWGNCDSNSPAFQYVKNNIQKKAK